MKAGIAASIMSAALRAEYRQNWHGDVVLTLAADEETDGRWGMQHLLATVPEATGDAMINGDAGSPSVIRIGEKGYVWVELQARGKPGHGAHVHLGLNAIDSLSAALDHLRRLRNLKCDIPGRIRAVIDAARPVSETISGTGEAEVLQSISVNVGRIEGGTSLNLIPDKARALVDVRLPFGVDVGLVVRELDAIVRELPEIDYRIIGSHEPSVSDPEHEIVQLALANARSGFSDATVVNMRVGLSDARLYRQTGIPSIVYGPTPHNMGGPDEYVTIDDLHAIFQVHALTGCDYLRTGAAA
jgi:acetylornithine deacetylase/succinyl-diaminopimelate desuccinylase-like protein